MSAVFILFKLFLLTVLVAPFPEIAIKFQRFFLFVPWLFFPILRARRWPIEIKLPAPSNSIIILEEWHNKVFIIRRFGKAKTFIGCNTCHFCSNQFAQKIVYHMVWSHSNRNIQYNMLELQCDNTWMYYKMVPRGGFEPPTRWISVLCSCKNLRRHI